jgi:steroid 5-alpha reductase family enzyme
MSKTVKVLIFMAAIIITIFGLLVLQMLGNKNGTIYPKWPATVLIMGVYFVLFGKKKNERSKED